MDTSIVIFNVYRQDKRL